MNDLKIKNFLREKYPNAVNLYHACMNSFKYTKNIFHNLWEKPIIVLLYHRVADLDTDSQFLAVSLKNFEEQICFLKKNYTILRFEDEWNHIEEPSISITFDDGYFDNYLNAWPILEKYKVPATIFVSTGNIDNNIEFWWDELERIVLLNKNFPKKLTLKTDDGIVTLGGEDKKGLNKSYAKLHSILKKSEKDKREEYLNLLKMQVGNYLEERPLYRSLNKDELYKLSLSPYITIGGHTISHTCLSIQTRERQEEEIRKSKLVLESIIKKELKVFSYPFGEKNDYNEETISILKNVSYIKAAANFPGQYHSSTDSYEIPRHLIRNWNLEEFKKQLKRFFYI